MVSIRSKYSHKCGRCSHERAWQLSSVDILRKIQYQDENDEFKDVDGGFVFDANYDQHSLVKIFFENPIRTKAIRFYPQSWDNHASGRFGILRGGSSMEGYTIMNTVKSLAGFSF